jgi:ribonuclease BN (tRNA processing enzyme)
VDDCLYAGCVCTGEPVGRARFLAMAATMAGSAVAMLPSVARAAADSAPPPAARTSVDQLVILGTAAGPPAVPGRFGIASALVIGGKTYVIDCGRAAVTQYVNCGLSLEQLDGIFVTHLHADHTTDLFNFFLLGSGWSAPHDSLRHAIPVYGPGSAGGLPLATPPDRKVATVDPQDPTPGIATLLRDCNDAYAYSTNVLMRDSGFDDIGSFMDAREIALPSVGASPTGDTAPAMRPFTIATLADITVSATLVPHGVCFPSYAFRFDTPQGSVVFSGDTAPSPNLIALARGADILVHEAIDLQFFKGHGYTPTFQHHMVTSHTDIALVAGIAHQAQVKTLIVSHLGPADPRLVTDARWKELALAGAAKSGYAGQLVIGQENMRFDLKGRRIGANAET